MIFNIFRIFLVVHFLLSLFRKKLVISSKVYNCIHFKPELEQLLKKYAGYLVIIPSRCLGSRLRLLLPIVFKVVTLWGKLGRLMAAIGQFEKCNFIVEIQPIFTSIA